MSIDMGNSDLIFLDIETTDLKADVGQITAIGILGNENVEIKFADMPEDEAEILKWFKDQLKDCKLIVTWNGDKFDIPFILSRCVILGIEMPELPKIRALDLCKFFQEKFTLAKYSLYEVSRSLGIKKSDEINWKNMSLLYLDAIRGDQKAKAEIIEHCKSDLLALKEIFERVKQYIR